MLRAKVKQGKNRRDSGVSVPFILGVTDVNEHVEPVFNAVLPSALSYLLGKLCRALTV